ncbi:hypothetical protein EUTSA_v10012232mg [Eutrema salsugineum]|uniref:Uncharacterized protein n=1 Tax=Eutrema salsugineum TaxID=72664 RepID=V4MF92_EUTSA|nr:hypothetical protein EUTSA_v10012232mg [Eutrema salsugineum]
MPGAGALKRNVHEAYGLLKESILEIRTKVFSYPLIKPTVSLEMIMVREPGDPAPNTVEYRHGLTPPTKDARKRRSRREPDLNVICVCYVWNMWSKKSNVIFGFDGKLVVNYAFSMAWG